MWRLHCLFGTSLFTESAPHPIVVMTDVSVSGRVCPSITFKLVFKGCKSKICYVLLKAIENNLSFLFDPMTYGATKGDMKKSLFQIEFATDGEQLPVRVLYCYIFMSGP